MPGTPQLIRQFIDGKLTLEEQEDTLNFLEQVALAKVIAYGKSTAAPAGQKANDAVLDAVSGPQPPKLHLVDPGTQSVAEVIAAQIAAGRTVVFHDRAFVESEEVTLLGFR